MIGEWQPFYLFFINLDSSNKDINALNVKLFILKTDVLKKLHLSFSDDGNYVSDSLNPSASHVIYLLSFGSFWTVNYNASGWDVFVCLHRTFNRQIYFPSALKNNLDALQKKTN